jgi:hypothetical protein
MDSHPVRTALGNGKPPSIVGTSISHLLVWPCFSATPKGAELGNSRFGDLPSNKILAITPLSW